MMLSTFLALLPGTMIFAFIWKAALDLFENPEPEKWVITITGVAAWIALIWFTHYLTSRWKKKF
jgi:hypothetical protein